MRHHLIGETVEVVSHNQHVAHSAATILDPVREDRFDAESQALEGCASRNLVRSHHRGELLETECLGEFEDFGSEAFAEPASTESVAADHANLTYTARPAGLFEMDAGIGGHFAINLR